jgi:hypothetical protein
VNQMSPVEFAELWDICAGKEEYKQVFAMLSLSRHFQACAELPDIREYIKLPTPLQRATLLRALISHLQGEHIQIISAGMQQQSAEIVVLGYRLTSRTTRSSGAAKSNSETILVLMELKFIPIEKFLQNKPKATEVVPFNADFMVQCAFRADSSDHSKLGMRFVDLDRIFTLLQ